jgi:hypothetical protein
MVGIRYIRHKDIDVVAWDHRIAASRRPLVYAESIYLNAICEHGWDALVYGDYEAVFPLPVKRKWGLSVVYQPFFCQQLGLFAPHDFHLGYSDFIDVIPRKFIRAGLHLNPSFALPGYVRQRCNLLLDLKPNYAQIFENYNADARKNLRKCNEAGITVEECHDFESAISLYREVWGPLNPVLKDCHYRGFENACKGLEKGSKAICLRAMQDTNLLAYAIFLYSSHYAHYVCGAPTAEGRKRGVMHTIIDYVAQKHAGEHLFLDFEGSEIPEVAAFYRKFVPIEEKYGVWSRKTPGL